MNKSIFRKEVLDKIYKKYHGQVFNKRKFPWVIPICFILATFLICLAIDIDIVDKINLGIKFIL